MTNKYPYYQRHSWMNGRVAPLALLLCTLAGSRAWAVDPDEPGLGPPVEAPAEPTKSPGAAAVAQPASAPTLAPLDPQAGPNLAERSGQLAMVARTCASDRRCPHFDLLVRWAQDPQHGSEAVRLLVALGDPRAAGVVALAAAYGATAALRDAALTALRRLGENPQTRAAVARIGASDPDPQLRAVASLALTKEGDPGAAQAAALAAAKSPASVVASPQRASDPGRVVYLQTAIPPEAGTVHWTAHDLVLHSVDYALTDYLEIGASVLIPVGVYGIFPRVRASYSLSETLHVAFVAMGGVLGTFIDDDAAQILLYGGGPVVTIGTEKLFLNLSLLAGGASLFDRETDYLVPEPGGTPRTVTRDTAEHHWLMLPHVGASWRFRHNLRLNLELLTPLGDHSRNGQIWGILYGLRLFGESIYGDISFVIPVFEDADEILKYAWLGLPLLSFGYQWR